MEKIGNRTYRDTYGTVLGNVHRKKDCVKPCPFHYPTDHHMRSWATLWRTDRWMLERLCPVHLVGHPDPDTKFMKWDDGTHGCCGCCRESEE